MQLHVDGVYLATGCYYSETAACTLRFKADEFLCCILMIPSCDSSYEGKIIKKGDIKGQVNNPVVLNLAFQDELMRYFILRYHVFSMYTYSYV